MAAVSQIIPNLLGGISQQPDPTKLPGQVREAENVYLDPTFGCRKRPATRFVGVLDEDIPNDAKWISIFRDNQERYFVAIYSKNSEVVVRVWDDQGVERTVNYNRSNATDYLGASRYKDIHALSLADYTLLCNSEKQVTGNTVADEYDKKEAIVTINQVAYNTTYSIDLQKDGDGDATVKVTKASKISVSPSSWDDDDDSCEFDAVEEFLVDADPDANDEYGGNGKNLAFRLVTTGSPFKSGPDPDDDYECKYQTEAILRNGGSGWKVGDRIKVRMQGKDYRLTIEEVKEEYVFATAGTATFTTASNTEGGALNVADIVNGLVNEVNQIGNFVAEGIGNCIRIRKDNNRDFGISVRGGTVNSAMDSFKETASDISKLPSQCFPDFRVKVRNTEESDSDDYYVKFVPDSEGIPGAGSWEETVGQGMGYTLNSSSMPWTLIRQSDGTFDLKPLDSSSPFGGWAAREVGDDTSNPKPSFVGKGISQMFLYANRLGFLSEDAVIMSQPGDYFNFFVTSAIAISDADPIDITASGSKPVFLKAASGTPRGVLLFSEHNQFLLATEEVVFSSSTVKLTELSDYAYRSDVMPISTGVSIMFPTENDSYAKVFELAVDSVQNRPQVADITRAVPQYIPNNLTLSAVSPNNDFVVWGKGNKKLYTFKYYNTAEGRALAGWSTWRLASDVKFVDFDKDVIYMVCRNQGRTILLAGNLLDGSDAPIDAGFSTFEPRLDHVINKDQVTIVEGGPGDDFDKIYLPDGVYSPGEQPTIVLTNSATFFQPDIQGDNENGYYIEVLKDRITGEDFYVGMEYIGKIVLPSFFVTQENRADRVDIPMVQYLYINFYYSGRYTIEVDKLGYDKYVQDIDVTRTNIYIADAPSIEEDGSNVVPIFCRGDYVNVTILSKDPFPQSITNYSWQGQYNKRGIRPIG